MPQIKLRAAKMAMVQPSNVATETARRRRLEARRAVASSANCSWESRGGGLGAGVMGASSIERAGRVNRCWALHLTVLCSSADIAFNNYG